MTEHSDDWRAGYIQGLRDYESKHGVPSDKQEAVQIDQQTKAQIESLARHSYGGRFAVYMSGDDARALLAQSAEQDRIDAQPHRLCHTWVGNRCKYCGMNYKGRANDLSMCLPSLRRLWSAWQVRSLLLVRRHRQGSAQMTEKEITDLWALSLKKPKTIRHFARAIESRVLAERKYTQADMEHYGKCYADARDKRLGRVAHPTPDDAKTREAFEKALKQTYEMVDPLNPPVPGSYARGEHNGIIAALKTVRANFDAAIAKGASK